MRLCDHFAVVDATVIYVHESDLPNSCLINRVGDKSGASTLRRGRALYTIYVNDLLRYFGTYKNMQKTSDNALEEGLMLLTD